MIERAIILAAGPILRIDEPRFASLASEASCKELHDMERDHIVRAPQQMGWRVRGPRGAAEILGLKPTTLESRMAKLGINRPGRVRNTS